jgi:hypothetical protein
MYDNDARRDFRHRATAFQSMEPVGPLAEANRDAIRALQRLTPYGGGRTAGVAMVATRASRLSYAERRDMLLIELRLLRAIDPSRRATKPLQTLLHNLRVARTLGL